jgi:threonine/homoserine/homoserine lactone efflux protein
VNFLTLLPMAFVMIAGPQILSAIFLATSEDWRRTSLAYITGAALSITLFVTLAYLLLNGVSDQGASNDSIYVIVLVLLLALMVRTYLRRHEAKVPKWMEKLQTATPRFAFILGAALLGVFPTDILTSVAVGSYLAAHGDPWWHMLPFLGLTLLFLAVPSLMILALGQRAHELLPKVRNWMTTHSWVVNEVVLGFFVLITINSLAG